MKKRLSIILAALMTASLLTACGAESMGGNTDNQTSKTENSSEVSSETPSEPSSDSDAEETKAEELPVAVDLHDLNGKNYVTPVKRQAFGDCWSFGIAAAAESSYLYENGLGVPAGEDNFNINFSERYCSWYVFHSITEEDIKLGKVRSSQVGEGYDLSEAEERNPKVAFILGGAMLAGPCMFASGFGPIDEMTEVKGEYPYAYSDKNAVNNEDFEDYTQGGDWSIPIDAEYRNAPIAAMLRDGNILNSPNSKDKDGNYKFDENAAAAVKAELAKGHAVGVAVLSPGRVNRKNWAAYTMSSDPNHVVTIVGYDDNYPKENFAITDDDGNTDPDSIPPENGAFLIKDSYGELGGFDGCGSYYLSYYDQTIGDMISFEFDKNDSVKYTDLNYDQYDMLFIGWCAGSDFDSETKMANVFDAEEDEYIYQISYRTKATDTTVHYAIYKDPKDGSLDSGTLLEEGDSSHRFGGSHKIDLKDEYSLKKGDKYSVVLTMTHKNDSGSQVYTDVVPYASNIVPYDTTREHEVKATGVVNKGESFLFSDEKWTDLTELKEGLAKTAFEDQQKRTLAPTFKAVDESGIAIDNYPIKAILVPADKHK